MLCVSILGLAAAAFAADRLFFQSAGASQPAVPTATAAADNVKATATLKAETPVDAGARPLAARLSEATQDKARGTDPFKLQWRGVVAPATKAGSNAETPAVIVNTPEAFAKTHILSSVVRSRDGQQAMIAKRMYKIGANVDGWKLASLAKDGTSATLEMGSASVVLNLRRPEAKQQSEVMVSHGSPDDDELNGDR